MKDKIFDLRQENKGKNRNLEENIKKSSLIISQHKSLNVTFKQEEKSQDFEIDKNENYLNLNINDRENSFNNQNEKKDCHKILDIDSQNEQKDDGFEIRTEYPDIPDQNNQSYYRESFLQNNKGNLNQKENQLTDHENKNKKIFDDGNNFIPNKYFENTFLRP